MKESTEKMKKYLYKIKKKLIFDEHMSKYLDFDVSQPLNGLIFWDIADTNSFQKSFDKSSRPSHLLIACLHSCESQPLWSLEKDIYGHNALLKNLRFVLFGSAWDLSLHSCWVWDPTHQRRAWKQNRCSALGQRNGTTEPRPSHRNRSAGTSHHQLFNGGTCTQR